MSAEDWNGKSNASLMNGLYLSDTERKYGALDEIEIDQIIPCKNHTFKVVDDAKMMELVDSIRDHGVSEPGVAFVNEDGQLEMLAGHRRKRACEILGLPTMPMIGGAAAMYYTNNKIEQLADEMECNFYIIPSSIHEVLLVPDNSGMDAKYLQEMVLEVNSMVVDPKDRLSGSVYKFDNETRTISIAEKDPELVKQQEIIKGKE